MKELSIEEKARAYDEAIERANSLLSSNELGNAWIYKLLPELKESDDERIRKEIIDFLEYYRLNNVLDSKTISLLTDSVAWLEKQGEQKPAWSEEDKIILSRIIADYERSNEEWFNAQNSLPHGRKINWLKSLKNRVQPQQEILEKLEKWLDEYVSDLADVDTASLICSFKNYLDDKLPKSLRPCSRWKPSDEQMDALRYVTNFDYGGYKATLASLYEQLKKLRGE